MMQNSKYTVLMSVYYKEKPEYLSLSIESMLNQTVKGYMSLMDFCISGLGQAFVCVLPNSLRKSFYMKFLRK